VGSGGAPWWLSIVTAVIAGGFALLGVRLTQRHAAEQRRLDRIEDQRAEQRATVVDLLAVGRT
jgi:membrane protein implicated in regulation of membrane protease activity